MVCVYVPRISCYFATPQHGDRWKITQNSRGNASSIMVDFPLPCFFGWWYASSKILVGHLGNVLVFFVLCVCYQHRNRQKQLAKPRPERALATPTVLQKKQAIQYQFLNFLAVKQLTTGSQPRSRSIVLFVQVLMSFFPRSRSFFWDFRNSFGNPFGVWRPRFPPLASLAANVPEMTWRGCTKWAIAAKFLRHYTDCPSEVTWKPTKTR